MDMQIECLIRGGRGDTAGRLSEALRRDGSRHAARCGRSAGTSRHTPNGQPWIS